MTIDIQDLTLDQTADMFETNPSRETADAHLRNARTYWHDGMIENDTYKAVKLAVAPYLPAGATD